MIARVILPISICTSVSSTISVSDRLLPFSGLLIRLNVEVDEKHKVAREKTTSQQCSSFRSSAVGNMGEMMEARVSKVLVCCGGVSTDTR